MEQAVVLFDGVCTLCNASVHFVIERDPGGVFRFASLQGRVGKALLRRYGLPPERMESIVLIEGGRVYLKSTALLRIARRLRLPWPLLGIFLWMPRRLRDAAYDLVARRRYRWFGREPVCRRPTPAWRARFLDGGE